MKSVASFADQSPFGFSFISLHHASLPTSVQADSAKQTKTRLSTFFTTITPFISYIIWFIKRVRCLIVNEVLRDGREARLFPSKFKYNKQFKQIRNARHFRFELALVFTAQWFGWVVALLTT